MGRELPQQSPEIKTLERSLWRIFLGASLLSAMLILLMVLASPSWHSISRPLRIGGLSLLLWSLAVTAYAYFSLYRFLQKIKDELHQKTFVDTGTGIYNFRYLDLRATEEYERTRRYGGTLSVLYMDLDKFKQVNDKYGHATGNVVLMDLATTMRHQVRSCDVLGRVGGDEFVALLPMTDRKQAKVVAERLRQSVEQYTKRLDESRVIDFVRLSVGIAAFPSNGDSVESVFSAADKAVYEAKKAGGNQVAVSTEFLSTEQVGHKVIRTIEGRASLDVPRPVEPAGAAPAVKA